MTALIDTTKHTCDSIFEPITTPLKFNPISRTKAIELVQIKLDRLHNDGTLYSKQVDLVNELLPVCTIEQMLEFYAGYEGFITRTIWN